MSGRLPALRRPDGEVMNREAQVVEEVKRHICLDETAQIVNGKWVCGCPGGPYPSPYRDQQPASVEENSND